ncbi:MAG TPA: FKBP-type peptidyl-prolyl cis-trans isomerase [Chitinophagaceae bacterium]|nr:FKBP-type peptidyl-prolyl cis-trans isomerase [Chitinophagaceae bacterium]
MKRVMFFLLGLFMISQGFSQTKPKPKSTTTTASTPLTLKTALDSFSYAMGMSVGNFCNQQGITSIKTNLVLKGIGDASKKDQKPLIDERQINNVISNYMGRMQKDKASGAKEAGRKFLEANAKNAGVVTLKSGVQYKVMVAGKDTVHPKETDTVTFHYRLSTTDGKVIQDSYQQGTPLTYPVNGLIPGWIEALQLMTPGSKWMLFVPSDLAYGDSGSGDIPPGATLVFEVELLRLGK